MKHRNSIHQSRCWWGWFVVVGASLLLFNQSPVNGAEELKRYEFLQIRMGIPVNIVLYAPTPVIANQASEAAYRRIREIDRIMSDYDPDSELMLLCRNYQPGQRVTVSAELLEVLGEAQKLSIQTDGAFDVTVGPVVKLWRIARRRKELPAADRLEAAREKIGFKSLCLSRKSSQVALMKPDMQIDLGGIAKGYAADAAMKEIKKLGVTRAMVDAGGDIVVGDPPPDRAHWIIEVEKLKSKSQSSSQTPRIQLANAAIATSGDVYQFLEIDGTRYSHIVDPKTGLGLTTPSTVTVIAPTGMQADSLASALSVLKPEKGIQLTKQLQDVDCLIVTMSSNEKITELNSENFSNYLVTDH